MKESIEKIHKDSTYLEPHVAVTCEVRNEKVRVCASGEVLSVHQTQRSTRTRLSRPREKTAAMLGVRTFRCHLRLFTKMAISPPNTRNVNLHVSTVSGAGTASNPSGQWWL